VAVTLEEVRELAMTLPRTTEAFVRGRVKLRVGRIVYVAFSRDETLMGFGFPKEERVWLVGTEPEKFLMPRESDLRYNWVVVRLAAIDADEMHALVVDASCPRASLRPIGSESAVVGDVAGGRDQWVGHDASRRGHALRTLSMRPRRDRADVDRGQSQPHSPAQAERRRLSTYRAPRSPTPGPAAVPVTVAGRPSSSLGV
jgi:hypothetical protein